MGFGPSFKPTSDSVRRRAAITLAEDMAKHLKVEVSPEQLADYINTRWWRISPLAHAIHVETAPEPEYFNEVELGASHGR